MKASFSYEKRGEILKKSGLRHTRQRDGIIEALVGADGPESAQAMHDRLTKKGADIDLSTVYRTLEVLEASGVVRKIVIENDTSAYYEFTANEHHHYLICLECRKIRSIDYCPLVSYEILLSKETDFVIEGHSLNIYGYCPECLRKREGPQVE